ncbi:MAG: hypothetical protein M0Z95_11680 [Actinomycetota bacterium]|jgi:uncharacterized membrane protein YphA (DoxX/SURF4 family)|nr:hypothetical protein [Actinomycetota bacterium]
MAIAAAHPREAWHTPRLLQVPSERLSDPAYQAYLVLRTTFVVAPILFGVDKFFNWMTFWPKYLWVGFPHLLSVSPQSFMYGVGVIEIVAGLGVLLLPRLAPYVLAGWLGGIITNEIVLSIARNGDGGQVFWDIALRDFGLMIAAFALARLAAKYAPRRLVGTKHS